MDDLLRAAGLAAGVDEATIEVMREYLHSRDAYVTVSYEQQWRRERAEAKAQAVAAGASLPDYHGAITQCQARVTTGGRVSVSYRCPRKPAKVRRIRDDHGSYRGDGRLAVCTQHAKTEYAPSRWVKTDHWQDRGRPPTADEVVEADYQP